MKVSDTMTVTPFAQVDFLYASFDGYSERGIVSAARVSSYDTTLTRIQAGVKGAHALADKAVLTGSVSVLGDLKSGDSSGAVSLLGQSLAMALSNKDNYGFRAAVGFEQPMGRTAAFKSGVSFVATSTGDIETSGQIGVGWTF